MLKNEKKYKKNPDTLINVFFGILSFDYFIVLPIYIFNHYTENKFCLALDDVIVLERVFINTEIKENVKKKILVHFVYVHLVKNSCQNFCCTLYHIHASSEDHLFIYEIRVAVNSTW